MLRHSLRTSVFVGCVAVVASGAVADDPAPPPTPPADALAIPAASGAHCDLGAAPSESVEGELNDAAHASNAGLLPEGPVTFLYGVWRTWADRLDDAAGLRVGIAFTAVYQHAFASKGFTDVAGFDADFYGMWRLLGANSPWRKSFGLRPSLNANLVVAKTRRIAADTASFRLLDLRIHARPRFQSTFATGC